MAGKRKEKQIGIVDDDDATKLSLGISTSKFTLECSTSDPRPIKKVRFSDYCSFYFPVAQKAAASRDPKVLDKCPPVITAAEFAASRDPKLQTLLTIRKALYFSYIPTKKGEEIMKARGLSAPEYLGLVEMRDVYPPSVMDPHSPWTIKKRITLQDIDSRSFMFSFRDFSEHVLRYWDHGVAGGFVIDRLPVCVPVLDVTVEKRPKRYENKNTYVSMLQTFDCILTCPELMRYLKPSSEVNFYWDEKGLSFNFKASDEIYSKIASMWL